MKEPSIDGLVDKVFHDALRGKTVTEEGGRILEWAERRLKPAVRALIQSERRKAALECLKARIEGFDIAYDCYDYKRLNKLKTSWNEELASLESNTEKEK